MKNGLQKDKADIDALVIAFFNAFTEKGEPVSLDVIRQICIPQVLIVRNCGETHEVFDLESFIEPRERMFADGVLKDFSEEELAEKTEIFGNVAQRFSLYQKKGMMAGSYTEIRGMKTLQFIRTPDGWRICAMAWDDERDGLSIPETWLAESKPS